MRRVLFLLMATFSTVAFGQIDVNDTYGPYEPVEVRVTVPEGSSLIVDFIPISGQQSFTTRDYLEDTESGLRPVTVLWGQPGTYKVQAFVLVVDFDARKSALKRFEKTFTLEGSLPGPLPPPPGPGPDPVPPGPGPGPLPPPPGPDAVPEDAFDNLGRRIDAAADAANLQFDKRLRVSELFASVAKDYAENKILRVTDARNKLLKGEAEIGLDAPWDGVKRLIADDAQKRSPMDRVQLINWWFAVAVGYKGGAL